MLESVAKYCTSEVKRGDAFAVVSCFACCAEAGKVEHHRIKLKRRLCMDFTDKSEFYFYFCSD